MFCHLDKQNDEIYVSVLQVQQKEQSHSLRQKNHVFIDASL